MIKKSAIFAGLLNFSCGSREGSSKTEDVLFMQAVGAMCIGPVVLGRAGILVDKMVTAYPAVRDGIGRCCARCTGAEVEVSGNVITCSGSNAAPDFAKAILNAVNQ